MYLSLYMYSCIVGLDLEFWGLGFRDWSLELGSRITHSGLHNICLGCV